MNPLRVTAKNYRTFEQLDLELPAGCVAVIGENGAGKSSIVNLVDLCLFGARSLADYLSVDGDTEMQLGLEFEHGGESYRVRRSFSARGRGSAKVDFEQWVWETHSASWQPLTRENAGATNDLIVETIGLSRETFRASAFLAQGDGAAFTEAQPRERKQILAEVLGLSVWDGLLDRARQDGRECDQATVALQAQLEGSEEELAGKPEVQARLDQLKTRDESTGALLADAETRRGEAAKAVLSAREAAAELAGAKSVLSERERHLQSVVERQQVVTRALAQRDSLERERGELAGHADRLWDLEQELTEALAEADARQEATRLGVERDRLLAEGKALLEKAEKLSGQADQLAGDTEGHESCDRCGQELGAQARERAIASFRQEAQQIDTEGNDKLQAAQEIPVEAALERVDTLAGSRPAAVVQPEIAAARHAKERLAAITERLTAIDELRAEADQLGDTVKAATDARDEAAEAMRASQAKLTTPAEELHAALAAAEAALRQLRAELEEIRTETAHWNAQAERLADLERKTAGWRHELGVIREEREQLRDAEQAYGRDGVPALIVESVAIPALEVESQRILERLGGKTGGARIELRTQAKNKTTDTLRETLDIVVFTADGFERAYEHWSGGEKMRLNLALRLALANVLANRRGAESKIFVLDEPGDLDVAGKAALVELLREIHGRGIERVFLVSHDSDLRDSLDQAIEVTIDGAWSRVESGADLVEAVVA